MGNRIKMALVDDEDLIVSLLGNFFQIAPDVELCFTANSGEQLIEKISATDCIPEVLILDLKLGGMSGIEVMNYLGKHFSTIRVIVMSSYYKKAFMGFMLKSGVSAFLPKNISSSELLSIIREVHEKGFYFMEDQVMAIRQQVSSKVPNLQLDEGNALTQREIEVLRLVCMQKTAKEIANELFLTHRTVEGHKNNLLIKTSAKNIAGLVIFAIQNHYVDVDEIPII